MPLFDAASLERVFHEEMEERKRRFAEQDNQRDLQSIAWWAKYNAYLQSPQWRAKRLKVLERDNYWCKACNEAEAVQVHHKTYEHVFDEPLFDLESVCLECHEKLHKKPL
jgi:5-methylcytosine-specific restriction endonuclease McrA